MRLSARLRSLRAVWLVPLLATIALTTWAFASPIGASPDDDYHLASIWCANDARDNLCVPETRPEYAGMHRVLEGMMSAPCFVADVEASAACQEWVADPRPIVTTNHGNWIGAYPPVYYASMNVFATTDIQAAALTMRVINVLIFIILTTALALLLPAHLRQPLLIGWAITIVPLSAVLIASNNPGSWAVTGVATSWMACLGWYHTSGKRAWALGAITVISVMMAAGARTDAAIYVIMGMGMASVLAFARSRAFALKLILPAALSVIAFILFATSGYTQVVEHGLTGGIPGNESRNQMAVLAFNLISMPQLWTGVFGSWGLGWRMEVWPGFALVEFATLAVFIGVASLGLRKMFPRKSWMSVALVAALYVIPLYVLTMGMSVVSENVQPRYILPLVVVLGSLLVLTKSTPLRAGPWHVIPAIVLLSAANSVALYTNLRRYVTGFDVEQLSLNAGAEWWWQSFPVGPDAVWLIGSLAFAATVTLLGRHWLLISRPQRAVA